MRHAVQGCPEGSPREREPAALPGHSPCPHRIPAAVLHTAYGLWRRRSGSGGVSGKPSAQGWGGHFQMVNCLAGFGDNHLRDKLAMAVTMVGFKAQQTTSPFRRQSCRFGQRQPSLRRFHMSTENRHHAFRMAGPDRISAGFRRAELSQVDIGDSYLLKAGGKLAFRKAWLSRSGHRTHVNQKMDTCCLQRCKYTI